MLTSWRRDWWNILLPSKLVCHRVRLSQPALMIKIVFIFNAFRWLRDPGITSESQSDKIGDVKDTWREEIHRSHPRNESIPFAVRYIKLVVECFESYHSHFDELARRINRRRFYFLLHIHLRYSLNRLENCVLHNLAIARSVITEENKEGGRCGVACASSRALSAHRLVIQGFLCTL